FQSFIVYAHSQVSFAQKIEFYLPLSLKSPQVSGFECNRPFIPEKRQYKFSIDTQPKIKLASIVYRIESKKLDIIGNAQRRPIQTGPHRQVKKVSLYFLASIQD